MPVVPLATDDNGAAQKAKQKKAPQIWQILAQSCLARVKVWTNNAPVQARFLLGPAGSGKTSRCLAEIRAHLRPEPDGRPLILLAPKQATFQLERQLLASGEIAGTTRLQIFSFDRLAYFILKHRRTAPPELLSEEGRIMVLRALLRRWRSELPVFGPSGHRTGFARELAGQLAELEQHGFTPTRLRELADREGLPRSLRGKLMDLARLQTEYAAWREQHGWKDANCLLEVALAALAQMPPGATDSPSLAGLWMDGFAEMTPQEQALLAALMPYCDQATLAFCVGEIPAEKDPWSIWSAIGRNYRQCRERLELAGCPISEERLSNRPNRGRFAGNPTLAALESGWAGPDRSPPTSPHPEVIRLQAAAHPEAEAVLVAREIHRFVRTGGGRYRDCAVLVRNLDPYHQPLARVFRAYEIPFFLDRRESIAHHPLAELTRNALRTVAFDWNLPDWFGALKTGFSPVAEERIDALENRALEFGWRGRRWRQPLPEPEAEALRGLLIPPYLALWERLERCGFRPTGTELAAAIQQLWTDLDAEQTLQDWVQEDAQNPANAPAVHATVWEQMQAWLENLARAFPADAWPLAEWLPVLEAGLTSLTVGVIPPALDEVLIGAVDRARSPDLKWTFLLGANEGVFPAPLSSPVILTLADREQLQLQNAELGPDLFERISREYYLGYIACTRATQKLTITWARQNAAGVSLLPSPFLQRLQNLLPGLLLENFELPPSHQVGQTAEHVSELTVPWLQQLPQPLPGWAKLAQIPALQTITERLPERNEGNSETSLPPHLAELLYGPTLRSSVSRLEDYARCPFRFFVIAGLRASERKMFELDARERGNFQHDVLDRFHRELTAAGRKWRDLTPESARQRIAQIVEELAANDQYRDGLMKQSGQTLFAARLLAEPLQEFVGTLVGWMRTQYDFDPLRSEFDFGFNQDSSAPAWEVRLDEHHALALRGRIDRIDVSHQAGKTLVVVMDYKSSQKKLEPIRLANGLQLQLPAYLAAISHWPPECLGPGVGEIVPVGMFYVNLQGESKSVSARNVEIDETDNPGLAWRHQGRFDATWLPHLDHRPGVKKGNQFKFSLNQDGRLSARSSDAQSATEFRQLLANVEATLRELGQAIYAGRVDVDPFQKGFETACDQCEYQSICRIDKWTQKWRQLRPAGPDAEPEQ